ncbi:hypothetical protein CEXT_156391 [Caerostris extrusa]|uniref:Uncharacterized protein n=1 Tax=Caerostris extrusa TaxID=172846 RepID=A0AAV4SC17_CAEEX|nr:hypothetical protein CEXT_156391 [Caerostris extrusa]
MKMHFTCVTLCKESTTGMAKKIAVFEKQTDELPFAKNNNINGFEQDEESTETIHIGCGIHRPNGHQNPLRNFDNAAAEEKNITLLLTRTPVRKEEKTLNIEALEIVTICLYIMVAPTVELRNEIKKLGISLSDVSDNLTDGNKTDRLMGSDYYFCQS